MLRRSLNAHRTRAVVLACSLLVSVSGARSEPLPQACRWDSAVGAGQLDPVRIDEASGLAVSAAYPDRLYHVNDSGDPGLFFVTDFRGEDLQRVEVDAFDPVDVEDATLGKCGTVPGTCLFIADIGGNARIRDEIEVVLIPEQERFSGRVLPLDRIRLRYPDGPHDAEGFAIHPNGDLFLVTKDRIESLRVWPARIYRLPYERWLAAGGQVQELELIGEIDFTRISSDRYSGSLVTALDISADGRRFLALTYVNAFEFYVDLAEKTLPPTEDLVEGVDFREIPLVELKQQESIAYLGENAFFYDTEAVDGTAPIMRVRCRL